MRWFFLLLFLPFPAMAQEGAKAAVLPWTLLGTHDEFYEQHKEWLDAQWNLIATGVMDEAQSFKLYAKPPTLNASILADRIKIGRPQSEELANTVVAPIVCKLGQRIDVFVAVSNMFNDQLLGIASSSAGDVEKLAESVVPARQLLADATASPSPEPYLQSALQIDFRSAKPWTRVDTGDHRCLDLRLARTVLSEWPTLALIGRESMAHVRRMSHIKAPKNLRPTRVLLTEWGRLDRFYSLRARLSESVYGQPTSIDRLNAESVALGPDGAFASDFQQRVKAYFSEQSKTLRVQDLPQIARVYGAWVYLDRGRAYGLKMDDRLVVAGQEDKIKGHVVGFYGPGMGIQSGRGFPVQEGAIVYIRLGQRETRVGQLLDFDPKTFPTAWPPTADKAGAK